MPHFETYSYTASTQATFYNAESEMIRLSGRLAHNELARHLKVALLAIDAVFAMRISRDTNLSVIPLIAAFELLKQKGERGSARKCIQSASVERRPSDEELEVAIEALHYMQTVNWISENIHTNTVVTVETVLRLHEYLLNGFESGGAFHGFRSGYLPHMKGSNPTSIPSEINDLCNFINKDLFSPLGQASAINHAFERIVPFDSLVNRTGLVLAFLALFKRGLLIDGYMVPICWGTSANKEDRTKMRAASRGLANNETYDSYREHWAVFNARNTYYSVLITDSFFNATERLRASWKSSGLRIPSNSAIEKLIDVILGSPQLSIKHAASIIGKSYGATSEAMRQLTAAGITREVALDSRERVFVCDGSSQMIDGFVERLIDICQQAKLDPLRITPLIWTPEKSELRK